MSSLTTPSEQHKPDWGEIYEAVINNKVAEVKQLLDDCLDPNLSIPTGLAEDDTFAGCTLLYMACVNNYLDSVKILLKASADPYKGKEVQSRTDFQYSPFYYAVTQKRVELMRVLLLENNVRESDFSPPFHYGIFRQLDDDIDVVKTIIEICKDPQHIFRNVGNFMLEAAKCRSNQLCRHLLSQCEIMEAVNEINDGLDLSDDSTTRSDELGYLIELYGARTFVEDDELRHSVMSIESPSTLEMLLNLFYRLYGDDKQWWKDQMMFNWTNDGITEGDTYMHHCLFDSTPNTRESRFEVLLRWGVYSVLQDIPLRKLDGQTQDTPYINTFFFALAATCNNERNSNTFISLCPQYLQEEWISSDKFGLVMDKILENAGNEVHIYLRSMYYHAVLILRRTSVPHLKELCRNAIFHRLGINPIPKAEQLPLPRKLKDYVQGKELFERNIQSA